MELLRFATAGSVDDGKSTLIGRLLYDSKAIFEDQLEAVERVSRQRGDEYTDLALLTDGLRAEREQGITIDVAYRYFATPLRKFIIADTPGHIQYTRNMVTGNSTADLTLVLVDARKGIVEQTRRHAFLASLLRVPHLLVCVNKMDLVDYDEEVFDAIREEFTAFATRLEVTDLALHPHLGAPRRQRGAAVAQHDVVRGPLAPAPPRTGLHRVGPQPDRPPSARPMGGAAHSLRRSRDYRGYAGRVAGGVFRPGRRGHGPALGAHHHDRRHRHLRRPGGRGVPADVGDGAARPRTSTSRAATCICRPHNQPTVGQDIDAMVCWMTDRPLAEGDFVALKHTTRWVRAVVRRHPLPARRQHAAPRRVGDARCGSTTWAG